MDVDNVERLSEVPQFSWSTYSFKREGELFSYRQTVGASAGKALANVGWRGNELVAFRMHLPSKIAYHNAGAGNPQRGNILAWEQPMAERLRGTPLTLDARMETQSILYRTLALFGATFVVVALLFLALLWWVLRRGANPPAQV
jgi:membrane-bound lytic murein transglycosylase B